MKILGLVLAVTVLISCNVQYNKNGMTGLETNANGLSYESIGLYIDNQEINTNEITLGQNVICQLTGVSGFTQEDGLCFIGGSMIITDETGNELLNEPDLFAQYDEEGLSPEDASYLSMSLQTNPPMEVGKTYTWKMRFWDKKGKGEINASTKVIIK